MKWIKFILSFALGIALIILLNSSHGNIPPLGKFFDPFNGFWRNNATQDDLPETLHINGLDEPVTIVWENRRVPHIFAQNNHDLFFAQGFITARDRLWQMEFQTHAAAGRLSEIVGERTVEYDRFFRRIGMVQAAEAALTKMLENSDTRIVLEAFSEGVNAYINSLKPRDFPLEYKILNYQPEPWTPLKSAYLLKSMAWDLTGYFFQELYLSQAKSLLNEQDIEKLYPTIPPFTDPIVPEGTKWDFKPLSPRHNLINNFETTDALFKDSNNSESNRGSNNWAVSGKRTSSGFPILCNDPHLHLTLPSIWYEVQLITPSMNVYGVSLPGAPSVVIGFNEHIAWGLTNAETDVIDWYEIQLRSEPTIEYLYDCAWHPVKIQLEEIKVRHRETITDTVYYTHHGPIVYRQHEKPQHRRIPVGAALRWTGHDPSNELQTFLDLNRASNYNDYISAIANFTCPAQNFIFASKSGDIAIWHNGTIPIRKPDQGRFILNGEKSQNEWQGWIPHSHLPHVKNPPQGFICSANQYPAPKNYPYYLTGNYASFTRSSRIHNQLSSLDSITAENMITLQLDIYNLFAQKALPLMLSFLPQNGLNISEKKAVEMLKTWDFENNVDAICPTLFEYWWDQLSELIWNDEGGGNLPTPRSDATLAIMLNDPFSQYFDVNTTPQKENLQDIVVFSFQKSIQSLTAELGELSDNWKWGNVHQTDILHLARIPGLGRKDIPTNGRAEIVNAISKRHGPSWRMVVDLGEPMRAWGIYPGGQSGNPGSQFYDHMIQNWVSGKINELVFLKSENESNEHVVAKTLLLNK